ncbi:MAG: hypothetical protein QNJ61_12235 [Desulfobacterales bacterium]|nr:hypothetical protein [Desulfobacterales bacterium]
MPPNIKEACAAAPVEGVYVNFFKVGYNADVFVFDQYQIFGDDHDSCADDVIASCPRLRMIASPMDAKQLLKQLEASIEAYEKHHGPIPLSEPSPHKTK